MCKVVSLAECMVCLIVSVCENVFVSASAIQLISCVTILRLTAYILLRLNP